MPFHRVLPRILPLAALLGLIATPALVTPALADMPPVPKVGQETPRPVAAPYGAPEGAQAQVDAAFRTAQASGRNVLIDFGGNWCPDCRMLAGVLALPSVAPWVAQRFVTVTVNVGRINTNLDIAQHYGVTIHAVPTVLIVTPQGRLLNPDGALALGDARRMSAQAVVDLLAGWDARDH
ncbi:Thioredoxin domain [Gluconacetobacter diazotrophicus PA1 5]|uniref:Thioredoxin family protein n=2 Tax=Gluconacetobacter diazotrophicus TaxID=33996 RepID=A0A7W4NNQ6_GLUDI|nr:thioredoxin family protein [Gluconacetobacter diazotrophicus]ACI52987.1 Thioredoxin domain [Gluconacetobacter diazotrophicus PA1 5]MBB2157680.1 thioredoxin family protein [Gluconacetobacter diazotrophicus]TWA98162.1 thiol-disulfide isomerase/thioredoxin [Gluconacetobacter diazotrophicus]CAP57050.1 putative thioredoxin protein [Gluconacetobacter diazotrophicus PA1 5]